MYFDIKLQSKKTKNNNENRAIVKYFVKTKNSNDEILKYYKNNIGSPNSFFNAFIKKDKETRFQEFSSKDDSTLVIIKKIILEDKFDSDFFRNDLAGLIPKLKDYDIKKLEINFPKFEQLKIYFTEETEIIYSAFEGLFLGNYKFDKYIKDKKSKTKLMLKLPDYELKLVKNLFSKAEQLVEAVNIARDLVNEPANFLTPEKLENSVLELFANSEVKIKTISKKELIRKKMNAILAVGNASQYDPRLITLHYKPLSKVSKKIALVGKGVTYDSGGLSIKPTSGMLEMKADMAGAATVIGIIYAAMKLKLKIELVGYIPAVENMLSGSSYKPGDVITAYNGKTIEVKDTDAEGRIVLADALAFASEQKPNEIIDFATLTGAVVVALGENTAGLMSKNVELSDSLLNASKNSCERLWALPFDDSYNELLKSDIADVSNLGPRWGGAITAGKFLENFVGENIPYAHIDLAGPALKNDFKNYTKKYDTGFGVRLIINYLNSI